MASTAPPYTPLAPEQRRLLLAALSSYRKNSGNDAQSASASPAASANGTSAITPQNTTGNIMSASEGVSPSIFDTAASKSPGELMYDFASLDNAGFNFDLDDAAATQARNSIDDSFASFANFDASDAKAEKRKSPEEDEDDDDGDDDSKRHEGDDDKSSKKPGRKPLTSEPTTKRKAQNRAAQRAFRERKEKHLKDLETKVADLEKASESANHENSILRAQVDRLQGELKDYRRRMSGMGSGSALNSSPPSGRPSFSNNRQSTGGNSIDEFDFNFDFPRFGDSTNVQPQTQSQPNNRPTPGSQSGSMSSTNRSTSNQKANDAMGNMFGTGFLDSFDKNFSESPNAMMNDSPSGLSWNSPSNSNSASSQSPANSNQNAGNTSSCCTSPDETNWAMNYQKSNNGTGTDNAFNSLSNTPGLTHAKTPESTSGQSNITNTNANSNNTFDWLSGQAGSFDPVLFGDYREPQENIIGNGDFTGGFFEDGLNFPDWNDPFNFNTSTDMTTTAPVSAASNGLMQATQKAAPKPSLLDQVAAQRDADVQESSAKPDDKEVKKQPSLMACYKIWNQLQNCPRFHSGDFDIDNLCSELASKATCTETGLAIEKDKVEAALWKLANQGDNATAPNA